MPKVKTAISISKSLFDEIDRYAKRNGLSRSEVFEHGAREIIRRRNNRRMTKKFDQVYSYAESGDDSQPWQSAALRRMARLLKDDQW